MEVIKKINILLLNKVLQKIREKKSILLRLPTPTKMMQDLKEQYEELPVVSAASSVPCPFRSW